MALKEVFTDIADAIRAKNKSTDTYKPEEMAGAIEQIETGVDTSDATATAENIESGMTAYVNGEKVTGNLPYANVGSEFSVAIYPDSEENNQTMNVDFRPKNYEEYKKIISLGKGDDLANFSIPIENVEPNLTEENIKAGQTIFGVVGTYEPNLQTKSVTYNQNGIYTIDNDAEYEGLDSVEVTVSVAGPALQSNKTVSPSASIQYVTPDTGYEGLSQVTVNACSGTRTITSTGSVNVTGYRYAQVNDSDLIASNIKSGVSILNVTGTYSPDLQDKTVTPSSSTQYITADSGYDGLDTVTVYGDSDLSSENIRSGVNIFNVEGSFTDDATATSAAILDGYTAYANGEKITGSFTLKTPTITSNNSTGLITATANGKSGYTYANSLDTNLTASNIRSGKTILGVTGTYTASAPTVSVSIECDLADGAYIYWTDGSGTHEGRYYASLNIRPLKNSIILVIGPENMQWSSSLLSHWVGYGVCVAGVWATSSKTVTFY